MDAVTETNREAWEAAPRKHVREYDDLLAQAGAGSSLNDVGRGLLEGILAGVPRSCTCKAATVWTTPRSCRLARSR